MAAAGAPGTAWITREWTGSIAGSIRPGVGKLEGYEHLPERVRIDYPERRYRWLGWETDWLTLLSVASLVFSIPIAMVLRITV